MSKENMKTQRIAVFFLIMMFVISCKKSTVLTKRASTTLEQCYDSPKGFDTYKLCLDSILSDSRCPANATCVWQGVAVAKFRFAANNQTDTFTLSTLSTPAYSSDTVLQEYKIKLIALYPYPGDGGTQVRAEVSVTR